MVSSSVRLALWACCGWPRPDVANVLDCLTCRRRSRLPVCAGIVDKAADLDVAMVMGMGFPAYRGGLIFWADLVGAGALGMGGGGWGGRRSGTVEAPVS